MTLTATKTECRAKDPSTCAYHGAEMRMETAAANHDLEAYFQARTELEEAQKEEWIRVETLPLVLETIKELEVSGDFTHDVKSVRSDDPRVQDGKIFDEVDVHDPEYNVPTRFSRRRDGVYGSWPYAMRFQANRKLTAEEMQQASAAIGYLYSRTIAGESMGNFEADSKYSFVISADTTKSRRDDLGIALEDFEKELDVSVREGSPVRKTDRAGVGTKGTRLVQGLNDPNLKFEIYYDDVYRSTVQLVD